MASTKLLRSQGTPTNNKIFTVSCWFKAAQVANEMKLIYSDDNTTNNYTYIHFSDTSGRIRFQNRNSSSNNTELIWQNFIRDFSAWYHLVIAVDSTQATASDRVKFYLNGVQQTTLDSGANTFPPQNQSFTLNSSGYDVEIGAENSSAYFEGLMSYFAFVDGTAYDASYFGETDSSSGIWKIKTAPSVTYGNNGFFLKMDTTSPGSDTSGNNNTFTATGTPTLTQDNASNNFPTINKTMQPMDYSNATLSDGATSSNSSGGDYTLVCSMGANKGKWYWEVKLGNASNTRNIGVVRSDQLRISGNSGGFYPGGNGNATNFTSAWNGSTGFVQTNTAGTQVQVTSGVTNTTTGDIVGVALDLDGYTLKFYKNGTLDGTAALSSAWVENFVLPCARADSGQTMYFNFGNGFFSTTAVTSSNADAAGYGLFEYAVPTGYYTLCTKNLNTYG